jgi:nucleotide-binding universal stress UspA family protein
MLAHVPADDRAAAVIACAVSTARLFNAGLDGMSGSGVRLAPSIALAASSAAVAIAADNDQAVTRASAVLGDLQAAALAAEVRIGALTVCDTPYPAQQQVAEVSRLYDLTIAAQSDPAHPHAEDAVLEAILMQSGRPLLIVPYIFRGAMKLDRVLLCWDGGRRAARALHDALPMLARARSVTVLSVNETVSEDDRMSAASLSERLTRRGINAAPLRISADKSEIHGAILSLAADDGSDLIVMGGYDHSRLRERAFGGVTRGILETMTVPVLMSH